MRVVLASKNEGKLAELKALLAPTDLILESQAEHNVPSPEETGTTFIENALIKARSVAHATQLAAIADDSGLVVPALNGDPGIYSARYAGTHGDDAANNNKLLQALDGIEDRRAYFYCAMVLLTHSEDPTPIIATAAWHGTILTQPQGDQGFGYDPLFYVADLGQSSAQLDRSVKNRISHRGKAIQAMLAALASG